MTWFNLHTPFTRTAEYIGSEPVVRSTWIQIMCYCCEQENNGIIIGAEAWKDRQWQQTCGITLAEVQMPSRLWKWKNGNIEVLAYPRDKQALAIANRKNGKKGGEISGAKRTLEAQAKRRLNRNGSVALTEGKRKGREGNLHLTHRQRVAGKAEAVEYASGARPKQTRPKSKP